VAAAGLCQAGSVQSILYHNVHHQLGELFRPPEVFIRVCWLAALVRRMAGYVFIAWLHWVFVGYYLTYVVHVRHMGFADH
jgi:hypothetical protein